MKSLAIASCLALTALPAVAQTAPTAASEGERIFAFIDRHCLPCHEGDDPEGDILLHGADNSEVMREHADIWRRAITAIESDAMPPQKSRRDFDASEARAMAALIAHVLESGAAPPGSATAAQKQSTQTRVAMRRLNRFEYHNTILDLLGIDYAPALEFPGDDIGNVLAVSPLLMERYLDAAAEIAALAIAIEDPAKPAVQRYDAKDLAERMEGKGQAGDAVRFFSAGSVAATVEFSRTGRYEFIIEAAGDQAGDEPARARVSIDGRRLRDVDVPEPRTNFAPHSFESEIEGGTREVAIAFSNDYYKPDDPDPANRDRNLHIRALVVRGPLDAPRELPFAHRRFIGERYDSSGEPGAFREEATRILQELTLLAFRRPPSKDEIARLVDLAEVGSHTSGNLAGGIRLALAAILASPSFLFRPEPSAGGETDARAGRADETADTRVDSSLDSWQMASRLSYFIWASMPDARLFELAAADALAADPEAIAAEAARMLRDPRASALIDGFATHWLELRRLETAAPDPEDFADYDEALAASMLRETQMLLQSVLLEDRDVRELLLSRETHMDERLARHYGIAGVRGERFRRVATQATHRIGLLGHASILTLTSYPTRTSPVKRGKWILEELLAAPPPPPPPGVPDLDESPIASQNASLRERMVAHRVNSDCATCHRSMDPLGFALENFDAIGAWRDRDGEHPVDTAGEMPDGRQISGVEDLARLIADDPRFVRAIAVKLMAYALGRELSESDEATVQTITKAVASKGYRFSAFVEGVVTSDSFMRNAP